MLVEAGLYAYRVHVTKPSLLLNVFEISRKTVREKYKTGTYSHIFAQFAIFPRGNQLPDLIRRSLLPGVGAPLLGKGILVIPGNESTK